MFPVASGRGTLRQGPTRLIRAIDLCGFGPFSVQPAGATHTFAESACVNEVALQTADLLIEEIVRLVNQTDRYIRNYLKWAGLAEFAIVFIGHMRIAVKAPNKSGLAAIFFPEWKVPNPKYIAIVGQQFLQACACNTDQLDFHLFGSAGRLAAFHDILFPRSGGLDHLINRAIRFSKKPLTKPIGEIVNNLGLSIGKEFALVAVRGNEAGITCIGHIGCI
jgi:hypothetical protein